MQPVSLIAFCLLVVGCGNTGDSEWIDGSKIYLLDIGSGFSDFKSPGAETGGYAGVSGLEYGGQIEVLLDGKSLGVQDSGGTSYWLSQFSNHIEEIQINGETTVPLYFIVRYGVVGEVEVYVDRIEIPAGKIDFTYDFLGAVERGPDLAKNHAS